jgi:hypothetical protein
MSRTTLIARVLVVAVLPVAAASHVHAAAAPCAQEKKLTGHEYWFYELTVGVEHGSQGESEIVGRSLGAPPFDFCFRVPLAEVQDPAERTKGYVEGIGRLSTSLIADKNTWDIEPRSAEVRAKIESVAGLKFKTPSDFGKWYDDRDFLHWSESRSLLTLDLQAKKEQRRITELDVVEISPESYWTLEGSGHLSDSNREGEFMRGRYWDGFTERRFKIAAASLQDRSAREAGYKKAARVLANQLDRHRTTDSKWLSTTLGRYENLTGQHFAKAEDWVKWCRVNCDQLKLTPDGQHLTLPWTNSAGSQSR